MRKRAAIAVVAFMGFLGLIPLLANSIPRLLPSVPPTPTPNMPIREDFEDSVLQGIGILAGQANWEIVDDGTGNHVFQIDNSNQQEWPGFTIGPSISDGVIEYRVRLLDFDLSQDNGSGIVNLFFRNGPSGGYVFALHPYYKRTQVCSVDTNGVWSLPLDGGMSTMFLQRDVWHTLQVELEGQSIYVNLDGTLLSTVMDDRFHTGQVVLGIGPDTYAQFDDISVVYEIP